MDINVHRGPRLRVALLVLILIGVAAAPGFSGGSAEDAETLEEVVIGFQAIPNGEIVAKNLGWHEETLGVPIRWVQFN